ncbi:exodeoxyribonuclease X [Caudoviricetes sp.]|nr:exodeoxyribonuclease X [Caudoviricetes sp.]
MPFGKYRGQIVGTVIEEDAEYVAWLLRETENFDLDEDALRYLESCR